MSEPHEELCDSTALDETTPSAARSATARGAAAWHVAASLQQLLAQLNALAPRRSKASDGSIGDAAHASRSSDHNPWYGAPSNPTVTARDFTHDPAGGLDGQWLRDRLVASRDRRIKYIIWNHRITSGAGGPSPWVAKPYSGINPHTKHVHVSVVASAAAEDRQSWGLGGGVMPTPAPAPSGARVLELTTPPMEGDDVRQVQRVLRAWYGLPTTFVDGFYGPSTVAYVRRVQAGTPPQPKLAADGAVGPDTRRKLGLPG